MILNEVDATMPYEFYLSIDAHRTGDETTYAAALIEKSGEETSRKARIRDTDRPENVRYRAHDLKRYVDAPVEDVVDDLLDVIVDEPFTGCTTFVVNIAEKAGRELRGALRDRGASPFSIAVAGGAMSPESGRPLSFSESAGEAVHVSEREIVSSIEDLYRDGRLELDIVKEDVASAIVQGLEAYQVESHTEDIEEDIDVEKAEEAETNARSETDLRGTTEHAGLVFAAGAACWLAQQHRFDPSEHLAEPPPPVREAKRAMRPDSVKPRTPTQ